MALKTNACNPADRFGGFWGPIQKRTEQIELTSPDKETDNPQQALSISGCDTLLFCCINWICFAGWSCGALLRDDSGRDGLHLS